jgi:hypothetical protein
VYKVNVVRVERAMTVEEVKDTIVMDVEQFVRKWEEINWRWRWSAGVSCVE